MIGLTLLIGRLVAEVDDGEVAVRVGRGLGLGGVAEQEADRHGQVAAGGDHGAQVRLEVVVGLGLDLVDLDAQVRLSLLQALVGGLVEGLVVESAGVGDDAAGVVAGRRAGGAAGVGAAPQPVSRSAAAPAVATPAIEPRLKVCTQ